MPANDNGSHTNHDHAIRMSARLERPKMRTRLLSRQQRSTLSSAHDTTTSADDSIQLPTWFERPEMPTADDSEACANNTATNSDHAAASADDNTVQL
jgi:hypothetical protein